MHMPSGTSLGLSGPGRRPCLIEDPVSRGFLPPSSSPNKGESFPALAGGLLLPGPCPSFSLQQCIRPSRTAPSWTAPWMTPMPVSLSQEAHNWPIGSIWVLLAPMSTRQQLLCLHSAARAPRWPAADAFDLSGWNQTPVY